MTVTLACAESELPEHLYLAHASASLVLDPAPSVAPAVTPWEELAAPDRRLWQEIAKRLIALHRA